MYPRKVIESQLLSKFHTVHSGSSMDFSGTWVFPSLRLSQQQRHRFCRSLNSQTPTRQSGLILSLTLRNVQQHFGNSNRELRHKQKSKTLQYIFISIGSNLATSLAKRQRFFARRCQLTVYLHTDQFNCIVEYNRFASVLQSKHLKQKEEQRSVTVCCCCANRGHSFLIELRSCISS